MKELWLKKVDDSFIILTNFRIKKLRFNLQQSFFKKKVKENQIDEDRYEYVLPFKQLYKLYNGHDEKRIFLLQNNQRFTVDDTKVTILTDLSFNWKGTTFYLYKTLDNKIAILVNGQPSSQSYFLNSNLTFEQGVGIIVKGKIRLSVDTDLEGVNLIVQHRKKRRSVRFSLKIIKKTESEAYVSGNIDLNVLIQNVTPMFNFEGYDTSVYDLYVEPVFKYDISNSRIFRLKNTNEYRYRVFRNSADEEQTLVMTVYGTEIYNNVSLRIQFVPKDTFEMSMDNLYPAKKHKKVILIAEYPHRAQDNGLQMFLFLNEEYSHLFDTYYVITANSVDRKNLNRFKNRIVTYKSKEHQTVFSNADVLLHTHSSEFILPIINTKNKERKNDIFKIFLQHGVTMSKDISHLYGKAAYPEFTNIVIAASRREKEYFEKHLGFQDNEVAVTGFARFDRLIENRRTIAKINTILVMPTWRKDMEGLTDEKFVESKFFQRYSSLFKELHDGLLDNSEIKIKLYLHNNFQRYSHLFANQSVEIESEGSSIQNLLIESDVLITDFSSVGLDFSIMHKRVIYFRFDDDSQILDDSHYLPGPIVTTAKEALIEITRSLEHPNLPEEYIDKVHKYVYCFDDTKARERILEIIKQNML